ncbi:hypothetical protein RRF57_013140 [Xylaria bambusicola]|uniref:Secreted protein n=1 Tax=Xylaria bambusicola TaxID=326684 RepID=A0AAN7V0G5_9PEZI
MLFILLLPPEFIILFMLPIAIGVRLGDDVCPIGIEEACRCSPPDGGGGSRNPEDVLLPLEGGGAREKDVV